MPDSARQNAQPGAPAPLEEFENGLLEKKGAREGSSSRSPLFGYLVGIIITMVLLCGYVLLGTYGAVGGTFFQKKSETGNLYVRRWYFLLYRS